jgi:hypothetical protein
MYMASAELSTQGLSLMGAVSKLSTALRVRVRRTRSHLRFQEPYDTDYDNMCRFVAVIWTLMYWKLMVINRVQQFETGDLVWKYLWSPPIR